MALSSKTLRPGYLVSLKTSVRGGVSYLKTTIDAGHVTDDGDHIAEWQTKRRIDNPNEMAAAKIARSKANTMIRAVCKQSSFGLLCPEIDGEKLEAAIKAAREVVEKFNQTSELTKVSVNVLTGKVSPDDVEAVKAINSEIRDLMSEMANGVANKDVDAIRDAASRVKGVGEMLEVDARAKVTMAVETARTAATQMRKEGDQASVDKSAVKKITELRAAFVDLDDAAPVLKPKGKAKKVQLDLTVEG